MVKETNDNAKDFSKSNKKCIDNCKKKMGTYFLFIELSAETTIINTSVTITRVS